MSEPGSDDVGNGARARDETEAQRQAQQRRRKLRHRVAFAGAAAAVAAAGLVVIQPSSSDDQQAWAVDAIEIAEVAPRLLITAEGWRVTGANEFTVEHGETVFTGPSGDQAQLAWTADDNTAGYMTYDDELRDLTERTHGQPPVERLPDASIGGHRSSVFQTNVAPSVFYALWKDGDYGISVVGSFSTVDEFLEVTRTIEVVDVETWLSAMPDSVVRPDRRADAVEDVLADIPLPARFDSSSLVVNGGVSDPYQLGARVSGAVACAWFDQWTRATAAGDDAAAQEAVDAMATSRNWAVLQDMADQGDWPQAVWDLADAMAAGGTIDNGAGPVPAAELAAAGVCGG